MMFAKEAEASVCRATGTQALPHLAADTDAMEKRVVPAFRPARADLKVGAT